MIHAGYGVPVSHFRSKGFTLRSNLLDNFVLFVSFVVNVCFASVFYLAFVFPSAFYICFPAHFFNSNESYSSPAAVKASYFRWSLSTLMT